jgi:hypothetical protein
MSSPWIPHRTKTIFAGAGVLVILCCVVGPVALAALCVAVDRFLGGGFGIFCGVLLATLAALLLLRARHRRGSC